MRPIDEICRTCGAELWVEIKTGTLVCMVCGTRITPDGVRMTPAGCII